MNKLQLYYNFKKNIKKYYKLYNYIYLDAFNIYKMRKTIIFVVLPSDNENNNNNY